MTQLSSSIPAPSKLRNFPFGTYRASACFLNPNLSLHNPETWKFTNKLIVSVCVFPRAALQSEYGLTEEQVAGESLTLIEISTSGWNVDESIRVCQSMFAFAVKVLK